MSNSPAHTSIEASSPCPCGSGKTFGACCGPIIAGQAKAPTAEALMRARYSAHVTRAYEFLHRTYAGTAKSDFIPQDGEPAETWTRLEVHAHTPGRDQNQAFVDFSAHFTQGGNAGVLQEKAEFSRASGEWIYTRAVRLGPAPVHSSAPKVGRNDPCPCGSGKKYKHCCISKA